MARHLTPRGAERRRQLMEFSAHLFAHSGYHGATVAQIVDGLGVGKGVFYWYFPSKDDLVREILVEAIRSMRLVQRDAIGGELDPARRIEQGIRASMLWLAEHRDLFTVMELARADPRFAPLMHQADQQTVADALPHVSAGITAGLLRGQDPEALTQAILGAVDRLARVLVLERSEDADRAATVAIAFCRRGYLAEDVALSSRRRSA